MTSYPDNPVVKSRKRSSEVAIVAVSTISLRGFHKTSRTFESPKFQSGAHFARPQDGITTGLTMSIAEFDIRVFVSYEYESPMVDETS